MAQARGILPQILVMVGEDQTVYLSAVCASSDNGTSLSPPLVDALGAGGISAPGDLTAACAAPLQAPGLVAVGDVPEVAGRGALTAARVIAMIALSTAIWTPIGVWIGLRPKVAQLAQPLAQFAAAFPANLLGRSGSGKSTLLRLLIGLIPPTSGEVRYRGRPVSGTVPGMSMVFQSFALFPWLTVVQNVELGLKVLGVGEAERRRRALEAIAIIGLDGFESALPKELSGGMRQRVGFARALVTNPDVLLMDEPFSALDVLTAENLRVELVELWQARRIPTRAILLVTHNIEEAVLMADRILVLSTQPGRVIAEVSVPLGRPRDRQSPDYQALVDRIYGIMTRPAEMIAVAPTPADMSHSGIGRRLPSASVEALSGFMERVARGPDFGHDDLPRLAEDMQLEIDDLFPLVDAAALLGLARVQKGDITLLPPGEAFASGDIAQRKRVFREQLIARVPLAGHIRRILETRPDHRAHENRFLSELEDFMGSEDAEAVLATAIEWGRYAELFVYDYNAGILSLEAPDTERG